MCTRYSPPVTLNLYGSCATCSQITEHENGFLSQHSIETSTRRDRNLVVLLECGEL